MEKLQISFITVCFNGFKDTCELIDSLIANVHSVTYEIIVVDNASLENEALKIKELYPSVNALRTDFNLGFSGGNNLGIKASKGLYIFLINNDTFIESDGLNLLIERLESKKSIGAISPKIRFAFPPQNIQFAGFTKLTPITMRNEVIGYGCVDDGRFDHPHITPYLHGAALLLKREIIDKVGLMPELFFLYYEELDWCTQMTNAGYELWYDPNFTVFHKESQSTGQFSKLRIFYMTRNRLLYARRNRRGVTLFLSVFYLSTIAAGKNSIQYLTKGRLDLFISIWKGVFKSFSPISTK